MDTVDILIIVIISLVMVLGLAIAMLKYLSNPCIHDWEVVKDQTTKSNMEIMLEKTGECPSPRNKYDIPSLMSRKNIFIMKCTKCGKIDKTITTLGEEL